MANRIDSSMAKVLLLDLLADHVWDEKTQASAQQPAVLLPGQADPPEDVLTRWVRLIRVDARKRARVKGDRGADKADVVAVFNIVCRPAAMEATPEAVTQTGEAVGLLLDEQHVDDQETGHDLQLERAEVTEDPPEQDQQLERTGVLTVSGLLQRFVAGDGSAVRETNGIDGD